MGLQQKGWNETHAIKLPKTKKLHRADPNDLKPT
jgi:hypothetical protein